MDSNNLFCPPTMTRIDINNPSLEYKTHWFCLICEKVLLSENAAINHEKNCKQTTTTKEVEELHNMEENMKFETLKRMNSNNLFCPPTMTRVEIDNPSFDYKTLWGCLICGKALLSENAAINHEKNCEQPTTTKEVEELHNMEENMKFPCNYCSKKSSQGKKN